MPIVPVLCRARGLDPVLAVPSVIAVYPATERSGVLQQTFSPLEESRFMCGPQFKLSVASSRGAGGLPGTPETPLHMPLLCMGKYHSHILSAACLYVSTHLLLGADLTLVSNYSLLNAEGVFQNCAIFRSYGVDNSK